MAARVNTVPSRIGDLEVSGPDEQGLIEVEILTDDTAAWCALERDEARILAQDLADRLGLSLLDPATGTRAVP